MKKTIGFLAIACILSLGFVNTAIAQDDSENQTEMTDSAATEESMEEAAEEAAEEMEEAKEEMAEDMAAAGSEDEPEQERAFTQVLKEKFIEGGPGFMGIVLICLIFGLAIVIERVIYLNMATTNTKKLLSNVEGALNSGGVDAAKEVCRNTSGPVASIFYQGLDRSHEGIDMVEKTVISYGSVQTGQLEKGVSWVSLFIALAPMLGFMGTVIGMIGAFDAIAEANNISASIVAGGIKVALLTTVFGLIVAVILQVFYNYIIAKIDSLINDMENASISLVDMLVKFEQKK